MDDRKTDRLNQQCPLDLYSDRIAHYSADWPEDYVLRFAQGEEESEKTEASRYHIGVKY